MKRETYFTPETISARSSDMLISLSALRDRHANIVFQRGKAALLVLDMQDYFIKQESHAYIPSANAILPNVQGLINAFYKSDRPVIFTRHIDDEAGMMPLWWRNAIYFDTPASAINAFDTSKGLIVQKSQYDAFYKSALDEHLKGREVDQVVITGVMTHLCCETTARSAFVHGYKVFFCVDGTATYTEELHRSSLLTLSHGCAIPILSSDLF
jgi:isochorismate hydrolase